MKYLILAILFSMSSAYGNKDLSVEQKDFFIICQSAKFAKALKQNSAFSDAERAVLTKKMQEALVTSYEVKGALSAISTASSDEKSKLLIQASRDAGLKKWKCPEAVELYR